MRRPKTKKFKIQNRLSEVKEIELLESWIASAKPDSGSNPLSLTPPKKIPNRHTARRLIFAILRRREIQPIASVEENQRWVLEKLYRARWGPEDGVGCIIMSPTRELAGQLFEVLKSAGKYHGFSAGLLIGGRKDVDTEKERVNELNILVCTPGRLLQHMDETPNFECSQLQRPASKEQVLVLDEADRILDVGFKKELNAIISQLPKHRQTLLFSATQTKSVQDLARLSLKDPEYISVHEESETATPSRLQQTAMVVPLDQKLDMLWSFLKAHLNSRVLVFLSSCKQVKFVYEAFKKLRPGIPLKCLHGRMKQDRRMGIYAQFCEKRSVLFSTDVASRGLDFNKAVDWVVQVDCPEDVASYIHRVGRTARYLSGSSIDFIQANTKRLQPVSGLLAALLVKYPNLQQLAQRAFITYLRSIHKQRDKEVFEVTKLPIDEFSASLGLPMTPKVRFLKQKVKGKKMSEELTLVPDSTVDENPSELLQGSLGTGRPMDEELQLEEGFLLEKDIQHVGEESTINIGDALPATRVLKKKKLKINVHRPVGTRLLNGYGNSTCGIYTSADLNYPWIRTLLPKFLCFPFCSKPTVCRIEGRNESGGQDREVTTGRIGKKAKVYFDSDSDGDERRKDEDSIGMGSRDVTLAEQEELALKLLSSMHS
ncbi:hypothetical protein DH2020_041678 [Rehmannia glutinosa]|uniref:ATP-dependent RNA helicase n=1 Tax=Rehmannia glutinosa TaxID=99300 RepID=A0ABR0UQI1_REHGL